MRARETTRRMFLRGTAGFTLALPMLAPREGRAQQGGVPKRLVLFHMPEGCEHRYFWPARQPDGDFDLQGTSLAALAPYKQRITVIRGINTESSKPVGRNLHAFVMTHILTGGPAAQPLTYRHPATGASVIIPAGQSVDRVIGKAIQGSAPISSIEMGVVYNENRDYQVSSWDQAGAPRWPQCNPYRVFRTAFGAGAAPAGGDLARAVEETHARQMSVLDLVRAEAESLRCKLGPDAREKLDAHLTSVRSIEKQVAALHGRKQGAVPAIGPEQDRQVSYTNSARAHEVLKVQTELVRAMLAADVTRMIEFKYAGTNHNGQFPFVPGIRFGNANHHDKLSHMEGARETYGVTTEEVIQEKRKVYAWFGEKLRELLDQLEAVKEPNGSLLDNTLVLLYSDMGYGQNHDQNNLPIVLAGGAQRSLKMGQYLDLNSIWKGLYSNPGHTGRSMNDLLHTVCRAFGLPIDRFGEAPFSKGVIPQLLA